MKKLLVYFKGFERDCVLAPLFKLLEASFELIIPLIVAALIDQGISSGDRLFILRRVGLMALLGLTGLLSAVTAQYFAARAAIGFTASLRHALLAHVQTLGYTELDELGTSALVTRMNSDMDRVQSGINMALRLLLRSPFVVFGAMAMAFTIDFDCALLFVGVILLLCVVVFGILLATIPMYTRVQGQLDGVTSATRENLTGVRVLRAFCKEGEQIRRFGERNDLLSRMQRAVGRLSSAMNPLTYVIVNAAVILLIRAGAMKVQLGALSQGQVVALYNYMSQILVELVKMADLIILLTKAVACAGRIAGVMDVRPLQSDGGKTPAQGTPCGSVAFENVSMRYRGGAQLALEGVSFHAEPGQTVGIIGGTGSGKSTLVSLIPRFYDVEQGRVLVDGLDVRDFDRAALRARMAIVPQRAVLMKGTIRSNLLWGNEQASDEELLYALQIAQAMDIVRAKEGGLDAVVEQGGRNFSGGQRQRLTLARAIVKKPEILILDDSASALDYATDAALRRAIASMEHAPTTFIVSQRSAGVLAADLILVLEDGKVAGMGRHEQLLASCPVYREIYDSQFAGGEAS